jgi:hypothetical protein
MLRLRLHLARGSTSLLPTPRHGGRHLVLLRGWPRHILTRHDIGSLHLLRRRGRDKMLRIGGLSGLLVRSVSLMLIWGMLG